MSPNPKSNITPNLLIGRCPPCHLLFVGCSDSDAAFLLVHTDTVDILRVREVSNPPLETHLGVLAHEDGLQKANPISGLFLKRGRAGIATCSTKLYLGARWETLSSSP